MMIPKFNFPRLATLLSMTVILGSLIITSACQVRVPSMDEIYESKLFDRRIEETDRQKTLRRCKRESDRFRVNCMFCHTTKDEAVLTEADPQLTEKGVRARVMRSNPTFGLHKDCQSCHLSKFRLNSSALAKFGPRGSGFDAITK